MNNIKIGKYGMVAKKTKLLQKPNNTFITTVTIGHPPAFTKTNTAQLAINNPEITKVKQFKREN